MSKVPTQRRRVRGICTDVVGPTGIELVQVVSVLGRESSKRVQCGEPNYRRFKLLTPDESGRAPAFSRPINMGYWRHEDHAGDPGPNLPQGQGHRR